MKKHRKRSVKLPAMLARLRGPVSYACTLLLLCSCWFLSMSMSASLAAGHSGGGTTGGLNLDLTSTQTTITAGSAVGNGVQIHVGSVVENVTASSILTPAEYLAAIQVATAGRQSIVLTANGTASGGTFTTNTLSNLSGLVIPSHVTAIDNFSGGAKQTFSGDFVNSGIFYALSTSNKVPTATLSAADIINNQGGLLTSVLPQGGLAGYSGAIANLNLILTATNSIINHGEISSAGSLALNAASITNSTAGGGTAALLQAATSLSMSAASITNSGQITAIANDMSVNANTINNSGILQSLQGALNLQNLTGNSMTISGPGGTLAAANALSLGLSGNSSANLLSVSGQTLSGSSVVLTAKQGAVDASVIDLPNQVTVTAGNYNLAVSAGTNGLTLARTGNANNGSLSYTGSGDVQFHGFNTGGGSIDINTTGSISVLGPGNSNKAGNIDTTSAHNGGSVILDAGQGVSVGNVITSGANSGAGGDITLDGNTVATGSLNASGSGSGKQGSIDVTAVSSSSGAISTSTITDTGSGGGAITFHTPGTIDINGNLNIPGANLTLASKGYTITGSTTLGNGNVSLEDLSDGPYVVNFSSLTKFNSNNITVGGAGYSNDIVLNADCKNCVGTIRNLNFDTSGHFVGSGHTLQLSANTDFSVVANAGIATGSVKGARSVSFSTEGDLTVDGSLSTPGAIVLAGDSNGHGHALTINAGQTLSGSSITATTVSGDLNVGSNTSLDATGGNAIIAAGNNVNIGNGVHVTANASQTIVNGQKEYSGGAIAVVAGVSGSQLAAELASLTSLRTGSKEQEIVQGGTLDPSNKVSSSGGSVIEFQFPEGGLKTITNDHFTLTGGVMLIDPPGSSNNVNITGATFTATGQVLSNSGGGGGGGGGTGGGGGGSTGGGGSSGSGSGSDSITLSLPSTTVLETAGTSSSTTSRDSLGITNQINVTGTGSSIAPSDSTRTDSAKGDGLSAAVYCTKPGLLKENETIDKDSWIIAANKCQPFSFETADGAIIIGSGPAIFAPAANHTLLLKEGKLLVIAGETMVIVRTPISNVTVPVNSAATVEFSPTGLSRLTSLAGGKASVSVTRNGETMIISAAPGEQLVLAETAVPDTEIVCLPDVTSKKMENWGIMLSGLRGHKFAFDRTEMVTREGLLNCTLGCFTKVQQSMIDQIRKSMLLDQPKELKSMLPPRGGKPLLSKAGDSGRLSAIGWGANLLDLTMPQVQRMYCQSAQVKFTGNASVGIQSANTFDLHRGDVLVNTTAPTTITAGRYKVTLAAGTLALVSNRADHVVVRNVYERKNGSITVITPDKKTVGTTLGQELIVGRAGLSFSKMLGEDAVGRRRMHMLDMGTMSNVITSEVSLVSLLQNTDILSQLTRSEDPEDKAMISKIEKMAVALQMITGAHGNYSMVGQ